jgi:hypothetical protein
MSAKIGLNFPGPEQHQPEKEEHVQDFRNVEKIVEPLKGRKSFGHGGKLGGQDGNNHIDQ